MERTPAVANANLFADTSSDTPLKEGYIPIFRTDGPGLNPNEPMAIVQRPPNEPMAVIQVKYPSIPDGKYLIKNREADVYWNSTGTNPIAKVYFYPGTVSPKKDKNLQVNIHSPIIQVIK